MQRPVHCERTSPASPVPHGRAASLRSRKIRRNGAHRLAHNRQEESLKSPAQCLALPRTLMRSRASLNAAG